MHRRRLIISLHSRSCSIGAFFHPPFSKALFQSTKKTSLKEQQEALPKNKFSLTSKTRSLLFKMEKPKRKVAQRTGPFSSENERKTSLASPRAFISLLFVTINFII